MFLEDLNLTNTPYNPLELTMGTKKREIATISKDVSKITDKIARICIEQSVRPKLFFQDYDKYRRGSVHPSKFVTALDNIKVSLDISDINALKEKYYIDDENINYVDFVNDLDEQYVKIKPDFDPRIISTMGSNLSHLMTKKVFDEE